MDIRLLLGKQLKDDDVVELLDYMDVRVIYDFDRSHENMPDVYWAEGKEYGLTLRFNELQNLDTIFVYLRASDDNQPASAEFLEGLLLFDSLAEAEEHAQQRNLPFKKGNRPANLPPQGEWIRLEYPARRMHYEFREGELHLVTISAAEAD